VLLVYLSADGLRPDEPPAAEGKGAEATEQSGAAAVKRSPLQAPVPQQRGVQRTSGGVAMAGGWSAHKSQQQQPQRGGGGGGGEGEEAVASSHAGGSGAYASQCLYPADLLPFTRKKLFLIVESDNSAAFRVPLSSLFSLLSSLFSLLSSLFPSLSLFSFSFSLLFSPSSRWWTHREWWAWQTIDSAFGQPFLCLLSPVSTGALQTKGIYIYLFLYIE
jgi:hypothetical protein